MLNTQQIDRTMAFNQKPVFNEKMKICYFQISLNTDNPLKRFSKMHITLEEGIKMFYRYWNASATCKNMRVHQIDPFRLSKLQDHSMTT